MNGPHLSETEAAVPRSGRLEGSSIPELLWGLAGDRFTGSLILRRDEARKILFFREGKLLFASSSVAEDRLGPFLLRQGRVDLAALLDAGGKVMRGRRLGQALIGNGAMNQEEVVRAVLDQVRAIALSVFPWRRGGWRLSRASLPIDESITLDQPMGELILAGIQQVGDWRWIRRAVGGPRAVFRVISGHLDTTLRLGAIERGVIDRLVHPCRVEELCQEVYAPSYEVYRSLWALSILGMVERIDATAAGDLRRDATEGTLEDQSMAELLLHHGDRGLTGVIRLFRDEEEGALFLREGRVEFATTTDPEQSLLVHLLRRGVISDRDQELVVRRLLSGKRVGRLLAESGALDDEDVERFVREQVLDVARTLVLWDGGEFRVEEGLTVDESIVLGWSAEDVVMAALETCEDSRLVLQGLGGLDSLYRLRPEYLDRLDRMQLRPAAWEIVSLLREERTLGELLEARPEPDFEICRLLYGLEKVRVVEQVPRDEVLFGAGPSSSEGAQVSSEVLYDGQRAELTETPPGPQADEGTPESVAADRSASALAPELFEEVSAGAAPQAPARIEGPEAPGVAEGLSGAAPLEETPEEPGTIIEVPITEFGPFEPLSPEELRTGPALMDSEDPGRTLEVSKEALEALSREIAEAEAKGTIDLAPPALEEEGEPESLAGEQPEEVDEPESEPEPEVEAEAVSEAEESEAALETVEEIAEESGEQPEGVAEPESASESHDEAEALETAEEEVEEPAPTLDLSEEVWQAVDHFNRRHRGVYQQLRLEIGAGVHNYVLTCQRRLGEERSLFEGLEPDPKGGEYDRQALAARLAEADEAGQGVRLDALLEKEVEMVRELLPPKRLAEIEEFLADTAGEED